MTEKIIRHYGIPYAKSISYSINYREEFKSRTTKSSQYYVKNLRGSRQVNFRRKRE